MLEKGRLYSLRKDGTKDSVYLNIKNKRFLFGSSEYCTVRIYIEGIFPEHCVLTIGGQGKAYLEPLHSSALILVNGIKIKHKVCLEDNDVIRIFIKEFQFAYPSNSLSRHVSCVRRLLVLPYSKQIKPAQKFKLSTHGKNWKTFHPFRESSNSNIKYIPKKQICIIKTDILKKIPEYLLKFMHQESVNILYEKINAQEVNSCSDKSLIKCMNQNVKESSVSRRNFALKLYEFISYLRGLLNMDKDNLYDLWPILESVWKYCIAKASEDILFLPLKSLNLQEEITIHKKFLQSKIPSPKKLSPASDVMSEKKNHCVNSLEVSVSSNIKTDGLKQSQYSSRKISVSYKKRVSLAVKRYHLRKRKSIMMTKAAEIESDENFELLGERAQIKDGSRKINSDEQDVLHLGKQKTTRTKRKRGYTKKEKEELQDKEELKIKEIILEDVKDTTRSQNTTSKRTKENRRNKATAKKTDLNPGKENIPKLTGDSSENQITVSNLREKKLKEKLSFKNEGLKQESLQDSIDYSAAEETTITKLSETKATKRSYKRKKKEAVTNKTGKSTQECDTQLSHCQRITRSMAKSRY